MKSPHYLEGRARIHLFENKALRLFLFIHFLSLAGPFLVYLFFVSGHEG
jgi:hypothetical protein